MPPDDQDVLKILHAAATVWREQQNWLYGHASHRERWDYLLTSIGEFHTLIMQYEPTVDLIKPDAFEAVTNEGIRRW